MKSFILLIFFLSFGVFGYESVPGEYIVKTYNKSVLKNLSKPIADDLYKIHATDAQVEKLKKQVEYIEPNYIYHTMAIPEDEATQWALPAIDAKKAWSITKGSPSVKVVVVDTGIDCEHPALKGNCDPGKNFVSNTNGDEEELSIGKDDQGHGTHCAGIIAAKSKEVMGIAPNVTVVAAKFLNKDGSGTLEDAIKAINYGIEIGADVLSNSWGGGGYSESLREVIAKAKEKGILFVAAAGNEFNDNDEKPSYPASYQEDNIISVAATDSQDNLAYFSNYGAQSVHVGAPGVRILSTFPQGKTRVLSGTSMATPYVSGLAALIVSKDSSCDYVCVKNKILDNSKALESLKDKVSSGGLINAYNSLK